MDLPFFARFYLFFHRRSIKNAPRFLAEGGKGAAAARLVGLAGGGFGRAGWCPERGEMGEGRVGFC